MINAAVEGLSDVEAARRVIVTAGHEVGKIVAAGGITKLDPKVPNYNQAAKYSPWVVFRDSDSKCPVELKAEFAERIDEWQPEFSLRIAHSMTEAWLLADHIGIAEYFRVSVDKVPGTPESLQHAKHSLLNLCASSRSKCIRKDVVASDGGPGPLFVKHISDFARDHWNIDAAAERSDSLRRAVLRVRDLPSQ